MDFNDIKSRIDRVYAAIGEVHIIDWEKEVKWNGNSNHFNIVFGPKDQNENANKILSVISVLANLKDNLKNRMTVKGLDKKLVENEIDNSIYLQLVTDIDNQDKHGYPLTKTKRSGLDPLITNIDSGLEMRPNMSSGEDMGIELDFMSGRVFTPGFSSKIVINADITDRAGSKICTLDVLINQAITT